MGETRAKKEKALSVRERETGLAGQKVSTAANEIRLDAAESAPVVPKYNARSLLFCFFLLFFPVSSFLLLSVLLVFRFFCFLALDSD